MAVTPGLKAAAGIKKGDSMTVQRKLWADWKKNKEGDTVFRELEGKIADERRKTPNAFFTQSEREHMIKQFERQKTSAVSSEMQSQIDRLRAKKIQWYGGTKEQKQKDAEKNRAIEAEVNKIRSSAIATIKHPTYGTTYKVIGKDALNKILSKKGNIQTDSRKLPTPKNSRKSVDVKGLKSIKDDRLIQMALF